MTRETRTAESFCPAHFVFTHVSASNHRHWTQSAKRKHKTRHTRTEMQAQESGEVLQLHTRCAELTKMNDELRREVHQLRERISFFEGGDDDDDGGQEEEQRTLADAFADDKETFQFA